MVEADLRDRRYLADGVYAGHDGYQIWLYTQEGHRIALEPGTMSMLDRYRADLTRQYAPAAQPPSHTPEPGG